MSSINNDIRIALEKRLNDTVGIPVIAWPNVNYSPTTGTPFLKPMYQPTSRRPAVLGTAPQKRYQGLFTILCYHPENEGPAACHSTADTLIERFDATTDLTYNGTTVSIEYAEQQSSYSSPPWYVTPVTIAWYIYN